MKKIICLLLAFILCAAFTVTAFAAEEDISPSEPQVFEGEASKSAPSAGGSVTVEAPVLYDDESFIEGTDPQELEETEGYIEVTAPQLFEEDAPKMSAGVIVIIVIAATAVVAVVVFFLFRKKK